MFENCNIGIKDKNGIEVKNGDKIKGITRSAIFNNVDGWGREIPYVKPEKTQYQIDEYEGEVVFDNGFSNDRAEFVVKTDYGLREFYWFDEFWVIK